MEYDVRNEDESKIDKIIFADSFIGDKRAACDVIPLVTGICIAEDKWKPTNLLEGIFIADIEHWNNLKKAVEKAISLGWLS